MYEVEPGLCVIVNVHGSPRVSIRQHSESRYAATELNSFTQFKHVRYFQFVCFNFVYLLQRQ